MKTLKSTQFIWLMCTISFIMGVFVSSNIGRKEINHKLDVLTAMQRQLAGFMMVPSSQQTGPIRVFYDAGCDAPKIKIKERKGIIPKARYRGGINE